MDKDLPTKTKDDLVAEVRRLRNGIRMHRDSSGHDLCWYHPQLWGLLPEQGECSPEVPDWPQFLRGCIRYRQSIDCQNPSAPRTVKEYNSGS